VTREIDSLAIDPSSPSILYAGVSGFDTGPSKYKLMKSTNGGASWTTLLLGNLVKSIAVAPSRPMTIYVGTHNGIFKSANGGMVM